MRGIIKEELNRQTYLYSLTQKYGDSDLASFYLNKFCDDINKMNIHGGYVFKLVYEPDELEITGWTLDKETLQTKLNRSDVLLIKGLVLAGSIDINSTMEKYVDSPEDHEIILVREPKVSEVKKIN
jgi:hypothetical protein